MPPQFLFDISGIDLSRVVYDIEQIRAANPQRGDMEQLHGILHANAEAGHIVGYRDIRDDEFWIAGHIPGRPLFPGVLMIESAAQLASFYTRVFAGWKGFVGFGGLESTKFRAQIPPNKRLLLLGKHLWTRHRRICCSVQGLVEGTLAFETSIIGVEF